MARNFKQLKRDAPEQLEKLRAVMRPNLGTHKRSRLSRAGCGSSKTLLHDDVAVRHAEMLLADYKRHIGKLKRAEGQERLRFLTILHSVVRTDKKAVMRAVERMEAALSRAFDGVGAWILGAVEVEVVNIALLRKIASLKEDEARKLNVLERLRESGATARSMTTGFQQDSGILVHFHGIVDLGDNSSLRENELRARFEKIVAWQQSPYQIEIKRTFKDRTMLKNVQGIASYITKGGNEKLRYSAGFGRDIADDLDAKIWRVGMGRADKGADTVSDERGLTFGEITFLDGVWRQLMDRKSNERGYLVRIR